MSFTAQFCDAKKNFTSNYLKPKKSLDVTDPSDILIAINLSYKTAARTFKGIPKGISKSAAFSPLSVALSGYFKGTSSPNWVTFSNELTLWRNMLISDFIKHIGYTMTVGQAQKIVNMTFKFMYCFDNASSYEDWFKYCHMPLDSYILQWYCEWFGRAMGVYKYCVTDWSKITSNAEYNEIQNNIHLYLSAKEPYGLLPLDNSSLKSEFIIWNFMR